MITRSRLESVAKDSGFRQAAVEKVMRLCGILRRLDTHPTTAGAWLLKGGTALNLLHLDVPRMSIDIDLNFIGAVDRDGMVSARPGFEAALEAVCEREGCTVKRVPSEHAGGKFRLRFVSVLGGPQNLEIDVSYVARVPLLGTERLSTRFPRGDSVEVTTLPLLELAAGKFTALTQRSVPRDAFDAANLLGLLPNLLEDPGFRLAFVCSVAGGRHDPRELTPVDPTPTALAIKQQLIPVMQEDLEAPPLDPLAQCERLKRQLQGVAARLLNWSPAERAFLDRLHDKGEVDATLLHSDPAMQQRIRTQPLLLWKAQNVRQHGEGKP
jgi:predicted nucleotidyltransferase component of viral defense system